MDDESEKLHEALVTGIVRRGLEHSTDDQLRAECIRRFPRGFGQAHETTIAERDEWKRRALEAEKAHAMVLANSTRTDCEHHPDSPRTTCLACANRRAETESRRAEAMEAKLRRPKAESGPGIAAMPKRDDTLDVATLADLLADDAP